MVGGGLALAGLALQREAAGRCARPATLRSHWAKVSGIGMHARISCDSVPPAPPVVLVHGLGMSSRYMAPLAECLGRSVRVFAPDLPGFGSSEKPPRALRVAEQAEMLAAWMDALGLPRAVLVGNSLGCEILVEFAIRYPDRVLGLVLQGPTPDPEALNPMHQVGLFFVTGLFERPSLGWIALCDYLRSGLGRYFQTFQDMLANRIEHKLTLVQAPTLVVWGTRDFLVPRRSVERVADLLPAGRLAVMEGAAHGMNYSHPGPLAQCVAAFFAELRPG